MSPYPRAGVAGHATGPAFDFNEPEALLAEHQKIDLVERPIGCLKFEIGPGAVRVVRRESRPDEIQRASFPFVARRGNNRPVCSYHGEVLGEKVVLIRASSCSRLFPRYQRAAVSPPPPPAWPPQPAASGRAHQGHGRLQATAQRLHIRLTHLGIDVELAHTQRNGLPYHGFRQARGPV